MAAPRKVPQTSQAKRTTAKKPRRAIERAGKADVKPTADAGMRRTGPLVAKRATARSHTAQGPSPTPEAPGDEAWRRVVELVHGVRRLQVQEAHGNPPTKEQSAAFEGFVASLLGSFMERFAQKVDNIVQIKGPRAVVDLGDPRLLAERMTAVLPQPHPFDEYGPFYRASDVASWLGESRQSIHKKVKGRALLGAHDSEGGVCLPTWQFRDDGTVVPHLREVVDVLAAGTSNPWTWIQWLAVPDEETGAPAWKSLDTEVPSQMEAVVSEARRDAARWAS